MPAPTLKDRLGITELTDKKGGIWKALLAEFLGNLLLNFFGCASCLLISAPEQPADLVRISLAFGLIIFGAVQVRFLLFLKKKLKRKNKYDTN